MGWVLQGTPAVSVGWLLCEQFLPELDFGIGVSGRDLWLFPLHKGVFPVQTGVCEVKTETHVT